MAPVTCDNCEWEGDEEEVSRTLTQVHHLGERLDPGSIVPAGECPMCGCFCYLDETPEHMKRVFADVLGAGLIPVLPHKTEINYKPVQDLYDAARKAGETGDLRSLRKAVEQMDAWSLQSERLSTISELASQIYSEEGDREIDIVGKMTHHNGGTGYDNGYWVDAWVWIPHPNTEEEDEDD